MKKTKNNVILLLAVLLLVPAFILSTSNRANAEDDEVEVETPEPSPTITPMASVSPGTQASPSINPNIIRERLRADIDEKMKNAKANQEIRNQLLEKNRIGTTTNKNGVMRVIDGREERRDDDRLVKCLGSTNPNEKCFRPEIKPRENEGYEDNGRSMQMKALKERKEVVGKQLEVALENLKDLRKRISSRIEKDRKAGKDTSSVSLLLKIADQKIVAARDAVKVVKEYTPRITNRTPGLTATSTASTTAVVAVNLEQIRTYIDTAQKAIKEAHKALSDVIVAIAKLGGGAQIQPGETPRPTTTPSVSPIATISPVITPSPTPTPIATTTTQ